MIDLYSEKDGVNGDLRPINQIVLEDTRRICEQGMEAIRRRNAEEREEIYCTETPYKI